MEEICNALQNYLHLERSEAVKMAIAPLCEQNEKIVESDTDRLVHRVCY